MRHRGPARRAAPGHGRSRRMRRTKRWARAKSAVLLGAIGLAVLLVACGGGEVGFEDPAGRFSISLNSYDWEDYTDQLLEEVVITREGTRLLFAAGEEIARERAGSFFSTVVRGRTLILKEFTDATPGKRPEQELVDFVFFWTESDTSIVEREDVRILSDSDVPTVEVLTEHVHSKSLRRFHFIEPDSIVEHICGRSKSSFSERSCRNALDELKFAG